MRWEIVSSLLHEPKILFLDEPVRLIEKGEGVENEFVQAQANRMESGYDLSDEEMKLFRDICRRENL